MERSFKLQSAMEYLMTYGWAILIIAVVAVALFALGVFGGSPLTTACTSLSGYTCQSPIYSHTTGNVIVTVGQVGQTWASTNIIFVPTGTTVAAGLFTGATENIISGGIASGTTATVTVPVSSPNGAIGSSVGGQFWAQFTTATGGTAYYAQIGTATLKAA